jgi:oligopeptide/dipeptide ABC transporter ATP-binding protein
VFESATGQAKSDIPQTASELRTPLLSVRRLSVSFEAGGWTARHRRRVRAVDKVSLDVEAGTTLGVVGESGCGKTTLARAILRLVEADEGEVWFNGVNVLAARGRALKRMRREMQIVFQDPMGSLNPRMTVERIIAEPLLIHRAQLNGHESVALTTSQIRKRVAGLLERVGLQPSDAYRYPHEFSGGQRQRIGIARAIALEPKLVICDEPVSALDVSVQAHIINLLRDLQRDWGLTYLFIAHNLAVVRHISNRVSVMYLGRVVEQAETDELFERPLHPYTLALLSAVPKLDAVSRRETLTVTASPAGPTELMMPRGDAPDAHDSPYACAYYPRCPYATDRCRTERPALEPKPQAAANHLVACHHAEVLVTAEEARGA